MQSTGTRRKTTNSIVIQMCYYITNSIRYLCSFTDIIPVIKHILVLSYTVPRTFFRRVGGSIHLANPQSVHKIIKNTSLLITS